MKNSFEIILNKFFLLIVITTITIFTSCHKVDSNIDSIENYNGTTYPEIFEQFWNGMNNNYVYWSIDPTDWDAVYTKYKPLFANLNISNDDDRKKAQDYFTEMTKNLVDAHYTIFFNENFLYSGSSSSYIKPTRSKKDALFNTNPDSVFYADETLYLDVIPNHYLDASSVHRNDYGTMHLITGTINNNILYLRFNACWITYYYLDANENTDAFKWYLSQLKNPSIKGIIIDVRNNSGGTLFDNDLIFGKMITSPLNTGYSRGKNGIGRMNYTPWTPNIINPREGAVQVNVPVVTLADAWSISAAEQMCVSTKALPKGVVIGRTTYGATGPFAGHELFEDGVFYVGSGDYFGNVKNGKGYMYVYTSSAMTKGLHDEIYEGKGVPPDIWVRENTDYATTNKDAQLDAAINYINK